MSDAYLDNGYGEKIIRAFAEKQELKFWEKTYQNLDSMDKRNIQSIKPEWYRKTTHSSKGDIFSEYAYVVRGEKLRAYHYGKLLFCLKREDAEIWLYLLKNMQQLIDHFLYSGELLEYQWKNYFSMFQFLQKKIWGRECPAFPDPQQFFQGCHQQDTVQIFSSPPWLRPDLFPVLHQN